MDRIVYLDSLRGVAALCVACIFHYTHFSSVFQPGSLPLNEAPFWSIFPIRFVYKYGWISVDLFFMLSGMIFSYKYADSIRSGAIKGRKFFLYRFSRLYPLHLVTLAVVALLAWWFHSINGRFPIYQTNDAKHFFLNLTFLQFGIVDLEYSFNGPSWSLTIEAMMYAIFWHTCRSDKRQLWWQFYLAIGICVVVFSQPRPVINADVGRGLISFFSGCLIQKAIEARELRGAFTISAAILAAAVVFRLWLYPGLPLILIFVPASACFLLFLNVLISAQKLLDVWPLRFLGDISLSIYLTHVPIQIGVLLLLQSYQFAIPFASPFFLATYLFAVVVISTATHYFIELPAQRALRKL